MSSGVSVDTTKTRSDPQRVRVSGGDRPIGAAAKGTQLDTEALCQLTPPQMSLGSGENRFARGRGRLSPFSSPHPPS